MEEEEDEKIPSIKGKLGKLAYLRHTFRKRLELDHPPGGMGGRASTPLEYLQGPIMEIFFHQSSRSFVIA